MRGLALVRSDGRRASPSGVASGDRRRALVIAHRLSTVAIADRVLVMEHGEIIEDDAPETLIAGTGKFAQLHAAWRESLV